MRTTTQALLLALGTLLIGTAVVSAGTVTSERVIWGTPYATVALDSRDAYVDEDGDLVIRTMPDETEGDALDRICDDARRGRYDYATYVSGSLWQAWNGNYYITCTT